MKNLDTEHSVVISTGASLSTSNEGWPRLSVEPHDNASTDGDVITGRILTDEEVESLPHNMMLRLS